MRTVPFREVWNRIVRLHGRDPHANIPSDMSRALVEHINQRVRVICQVWRWPEWELTEERAFRQVWNADDQYMRVSLTDGQPDEVFYIPDLLYYKVNPDAPSDPPPGTSPAGSPLPPSTGSTTDYFYQIDPVDTFIAYDQRCRRSIGMVLGVYSQNPRVPTGSSNGLYKFMPSERGVDVYQPGNPTVFIHYKMPVPRYTMVPYVAGRVYQKSEVVFDPTSGECFQALTATAFVPPTESVWRRVPFPEVWANYVAQAAFADSLMEFDQGGNMEIQAKAGIAQYANLNADTFLQVEIDALVAQGQKLIWNFCPARYGWCESQPWSGGTVSELTDTCQDELGWVYPTPTVTPGVTMAYYNRVVALRAADATPSLDEIATLYLFDDSIAQIKVIESGIMTFMTWTLMTGPANAADPNGEVAPLDYNSSSNDKHWVRLQ